MTRVGPMADDGSGSAEEDVLAGDLARQRLDAHRRTWTDIASRRRRAQRIRDVTLQENCVLEAKLFAAIEAQERLAYGMQDGDEAVSEATSLEGYDEAGLFAMADELLVEEGWRTEQGRAHLLPSERAFLAAWPEELKRRHNALEAALAAAAAVSPKRKLQNHKLAEHRNAARSGPAPSAGRSARRSP
ncbi:hypothetical protein ABEG18_06045 [Alsobacter sp. KACC 23698]|uniref:Uncharacterized protein n=1 Tax=Alsobacter sp. KACC 23698 TaxID=3149229 RepID=A0AAU7JJT4_9HYPH